MSVALQSGITPPQIPAILLEAYFDRSELRAGVVAVGGFLCSISRWSRFERNWGEVLSWYGVSCFHMTDFENSRGEFSGWPKQRRKVFIRRLIGVIGDIRPLAVGTGMLNADHKALSDAQRRKIGSNPYVWCAINSAIQTIKWLRSKRPDAKVACIFEAGDEGATEVMGALNAARERNEEFRVLLNAVRFENKNTTTPLQAADFFAYETAKQLLRNVGLDQREMRKSIRRLLEGRVLDAIGHYVDAKSIRWLTGDESAVRF